MRVLQERRGMALVTVLWLLVMLTVLASELVVSTRSDIASVRNFKEDREAYFIAYAGIQMAIAEIIAESQFQYLDEDGVVFGRIGDNMDGVEFTSREDIPIGRGAVSYFIEDENGKLNINRIASSSSTMRFFLENIFPDGGVDIETIVDSIADWVDVDDLKHAYGAENHHYMKLTPPYHSKNGDFDDLSELRSIQGITPELYEVISSELTVYPTGSVNINTASGLVLLVNGMPADQVAENLSQRSVGGWVDQGSKSDIYTIVSTGRIDGSSITHSIKAVVRKSGRGELVYLDWVDDYYPAPVDEEEE